MSGRRAADLIGATLMAVIASPIVAVASLYVLLVSPGAPWFAQTRIGYRGRQFTMYKLRTMHRDADARLAAHFRVHPEAEREWIAYRRLRHDPRILPGGRLLRRTSIDELPQLLNVLAGDMTLVGPRPLEVEAADRIDPTMMEERCRSVPGVTGLWQISGRSETTIEEMVAIDLEYLRTRSVQRDLAILARTPVAVLSGRGAY